MDRKAETEWSAFGAAIGGASCGAMAAMLHQIQHVLSGAAQEGNPFPHIMVEVAVMSLAGALLFVAGAALRRRLAWPNFRKAVGRSGDSA